MGVLRNAQNEPVEADHRVGAFHIYNRPGLRAFVAMLLERFVVGVWSSARKHNLRGLVRHIFGAQEERLAFCYGQEACTYAGTSADSKPLFLKELGRVWAEPAFAAFGPRNTLLVDDDAYKAARNPPHTAIHPTKVRMLAARACVCRCAHACPRGGRSLPGWAARTRRCCKVARCGSTCCSSARRPPSVTGCRRRHSRAAPRRRRPQQRRPPRTRSRLRQTRPAQQTTQRRKVEDAQTFVATRHAAPSPEYSAARPDCPAAACSATSPPSRTVGSSP